ncbi:MAG TPA: Flp family type IVb pilin [Gaiellaceae bacterium]|nr:Flp family type IVb pilin [Gaiellaceae bacterium]
MFAAVTKQWIKLSLAREDGQAMAEYGIILALIAAVVIGAVTLLGTQIHTALNTVTGSL